ncbi:MAG: TIGR03503 family protein [Gammaproteobacteria bacterium]|nr:MAG: TIGR03503 family protein [Gammaproteobacteria bacterium]
MAKLIFSLTILILSNIYTPLANAADSIVENKIKYIKNDNITNEIPYFDNRFRLDAQLNEITMLFYHKAGSVPVILIRPDGSKLRINDYDHEKIEWYDDLTFDMIKMKKPIPGPWQVIGDVLPNSQILVVSDVTIAVNPLPAVILAGETLKVEGKLINGNLAINNPKFRDVVELEVKLISTNNSAYENFGSESINLTTFRDDGRELDEHASDGIFTGEFQLTIPAGEWVPIYRIKLPMATRELRQKAIILHKTPISFKVDVAKTEGEFHQVHFIIDPKYVDPDSFIFQGKITYPDRQDEAFSLMDGEGADRIKKFKYTEPGVHRINVSAFGKTINGREFRLVVPEYTFNVEVTEEELLQHISEINKDGISDADESTVNQTEIDQQLSLKAQQQEFQQKIEQAKAKQQKQWLIIGIGNIVIILIGLGIFFFLRRKKLKNEPR